MERDEEKPITAEVEGAGVSRRDFAALSAAAGLTTAAGTAKAAAMPVVESDVMIKTPDGMCDAAFIHPAQGKHPAVIIWTDIFGLRPSMRGFGRRLAAEGYTVLVPNPFYRTAKAPTYSAADIAHFDFNSADSRAKMAATTGPMGAPGATERDATTFVAWLDGQGQTDNGRKMGTQGYCMGGPLVLKTAAASSRVGAAATFHGAALVTNGPDSPHLLAPKIHANLYLGIAANDDMRQPDAKDKLKAAFAAAHDPAEIEVYSKSQHGWCVPDMPAQNGMPIYDMPNAERAWAKLVALYKTALA